MNKLKSILARKMEKKEEEKIKEEKMGEPPTPPEEEEQEEPKKEPSLKETITELKESFEQLGIKKDVDGKFKKKSFKIPFKTKSKLKRGLLKNKVQVIMCMMNKTLLPIVGEFKLGQLMIETPTGLHSWAGEEDIIWNWNGKTPTVLVPEWDLIPITRASLIKKAVDAKSLSAPSDIIIRKIEATEAMAQDKKKMNSKTTIIIFVALAAGAYLLFGGGG